MKTSRISKVRIAQANSLVKDPVGLQDFSKTKKTKNRFSMKEVQSSQELKEEILQKLSEEVKNRNWQDEDKFTDFANFDFRDEQQKRY